jgi:peptidoglycan hydrolase-like protein with peptidoglycan-binding domain
MTLQKGVKSPEVTKLQKALIKAGIHVLTDGDFGPSTERAVKEFQSQKGIKPDGVVGKITWSYLKEYDTQATLETMMLEKVAEENDIDPAALKAIYLVEANGNAFLNDGRVKILFEAHIMYRQLKEHFPNVDLEAALKDHPNVVSKRWNRDLYAGGSKEYNRYAEAQNIQRQAAMKSTSFGAFQIMGFNHKLCGYDYVEDFVAAMEASELNHADAVVKFIKSNKLDIHLKNKDWAKFARGYNGPGYAANKYDEKLASAYKKFNS